MSRSWLLKKCVKGEFYCGRKEVIMILFYMTLMKHVPKGKVFVPKAYSIEDIQRKCFPGKVRHFSSMAYEIVEELLNDKFIIKTDDGKYRINTRS